MKQILEVVPHGVIQSGSITFDVDEQTGLMNFFETMVVGWLMFTKTITDSETIKLDPSLLLSKNLEVGTKISYPLITVTISEIDAERKMATAVVSYKNGDDHADGLAEIDVSKDLIAIDHILMTGVAQGTDITLELQPKQ